VEIDWRRKITDRDNQENGESNEPDFYHPFCYTESEMIALRSENVSLPRDTFDKLNMARRLTYVNPADPVKVTQMNAEIEAQRWIIDMPLDEVFQHLKAMESICTVLSLALRKDRRSIQESLEKRDSSKTKEALAAREKHSDRTPKTTDSKEKREERKIDKGIAQLMKSLGVDEETATAMVAEAKTKASQRGQQVN
jgi:hypothetical protein